jgi:hypothetical protein
MIFHYQKHTVLNYSRLLKCTDRNCRPAWHRFQPQGGKEYTVHSIHYSVQTFSWLLLSFAAESSASGPQSGKAPYHSLTLPHLFYLYISGKVAGHPCIFVSLHCASVLRSKKQGTESAGSSHPLCCRKTNWK